MESRDSINRYYEELAENRERNAERDRRRLEAWETVLNVLANYSYPEQFRIETALTVMRKADGDE